MTACDQPRIGHRIVSELYDYARLPIFRPFSISMVLSMLVGRIMALCFRCDRFPLRVSRCKSAQVLREKEHD